MCSENANQRRAKRQRNANQTLTRCQPGSRAVDRTERFYKIDALLQARGVVPIDAMLDSLEVSLATFKRDIEYMRDRLNAPIVWDREARGYMYSKAEGHAPRLFRACGSTPP